MSGGKTGGENGREKTIAISIGDVNGVGLEIALKAHAAVREKCRAIYFVDSPVLENAAKRLKMAIPSDFETRGVAEFCGESVQKNLSNLIAPGEISAQSGEYSFFSFKKAVDSALSGESCGVVTLPIHKNAWAKAGLDFVGHTDYLSRRFAKNGAENGTDSGGKNGESSGVAGAGAREDAAKKGIMMLGCEELFVALFTDHTALKNVPEMIVFEPLRAFLLDFAASFGALKNPPPDSPKGYLPCKDSPQNCPAREDSSQKDSVQDSPQDSREKIPPPKTTPQKNLPQKILVLGLNPHAGDGGVLGSEDSIIKNAIESANEALKREVFFGPVSPDAAFSPRMRRDFRVVVAMYHDQGLAPLKALFFEESINVTLGLPILRTSVDHGVAFDIAYKGLADTQSYLNALDFILKD